MHHPPQFAAPWITPRRVVMGLAMLVGLLPASAQEPSTWRDPEHGCTYILAPQGGVGLRYRRDGSPDCPSALPNSPFLNCWLFDAACPFTGGASLSAKGFESPKPAPDPSPTTTDVEHEK